MAGVAEMTRERTAVTTRLYVGNIPWDASRAEILAALGGESAVRGLTMPREARGRSRRFAFAEMRRPEDAARLAGSGAPMLRGRHLSVRAAESRRRPRGAA